MEEIVTIDGRQFKLTIDRPLVASERQQVIADIRKQTGCGSCNQPRTIANMGNDWGYGGVRSMATPTCTGGPYGSGPTDTPVTLRVGPYGGVGPYSAYFYIKRNTETPVSIATGLGTPALTGAIVGANPTTGITEGGVDGTPTSAVFSYKLTDADISAASGDPTTHDYSATLVGGAATGGITEAAGATTPALDSGKIRFFSVVTDLCPTGAKGCVELCDVSLVCAVPTCNFVVA